MRQIVVLSGRTCSGKSQLASRLESEFSFFKIQTGDILKKYAKEHNQPEDRLSLQALGDQRDRETRHRWVLDAVLEQIKNLPPDQRVVVDNIRTAMQLDLFRRQPDLAVVHAHLYAPTAELKKRFEKKRNSRKAESAATHDEADLIKHEEDIDHFKDDADVRINTNRTDGADTLVRVAARLGLYSPPDIRCVDVLVGGQYGSEGKGHVAAYLARDYDILVRVGGPNAGHTVASSSGVYTYHQLPSGARDTDAKILLGPGMTIRVEKLLREIEECGIPPERLFIDPQAMIIEDEDLLMESGLVDVIASTGSGTGAAAARRILKREPSGVRLARDVPELKQYVGEGPHFRGSTAVQLENAYRRGLFILLEGTQGSMLSLFHGQYPHVTSRDTNVAGCLAEAGISPSRVRRILMVIRTTPIRVGHPDKGTGNSGPLKHEVTFDEVATAAKLNPDLVTSSEKTSTTKRARRVGWFEWEQFRRACALNAPTDIVLTFVDYIDAKNQKARRFEQLTEDTIKFIEEIERVAQAPVSLINTRFPRTGGAGGDLRTVIDRRNWTTPRRMRNGLPA